MSVLVLFGLDGQCSAWDVEKMLAEAGAPAQHVGLNGAQRVAFARFAGPEECACAWRLARGRRLALRGCALRAECRDELHEAELRLAAARLSAPYEDPRARFVPLLWAARAAPLPLLRPPAQVAPRDRSEFVNAWKSLLLAEACAQIAAAEVARAPQLEVLTAERLPGARAALTVREPQGEDAACEEVGVCDAVQWRGIVGVVEERSGTRLVVHFERDPPKSREGQMGNEGTEGNKGKEKEKKGEKSKGKEKKKGERNKGNEEVEGEGQLAVLASLLSSRRAYDALNWFLTADLADNLAAQALFQGRAARFSPLAAPRAPAALNAAQARVLTRFALLEEGALLCQGPPGTGKTMLLAAAIEAAAAPRARVAVCAPSNRAVHEILGRFRARNPLLPVLLLGSARGRVLPPEAREVFCDALCGDRAAALEAAAARGDGERAGQLCAELRRWGLPLVLDKLELQCGRVRRGLCWACERPSGCACGAWAASSRVLRECAAALRSTDHRRQLVAAARVIFMTLASAGRAFVREAVPRLDTLLVDEAGQVSARLCVWL